MSSPATTDSSPPAALADGSAESTAAAAAGAGGGAGAGSDAPAKTRVTPEVTVEAKHLNLVINRNSVLHDLTFQLHAGDRCMVLGPNGAGKTCLLRTLAGRHKHDEKAATILGRSCFYDTKLNMLRAYLGTQWGQRTVAFSGFGVTHSGDVELGKMMQSRQERFREQRDTLVEVLDIDLKWHMHALSDGQRRRAQIMLQVILMDEVTTSLDVVTRSNFLEYTKSLTEAGATCMYATHVFDGMDDWGTHIMYINKGRITRFGRVEEFEELQELKAAGVTSPVYRLVEKWMRADHEEELKERAARGGDGDSRSLAEKADPTSMAAGLGNGFLAGRMVRKMYPMPVHGGRPSS